MFRYVKLYSHFLRNCLVRTMEFRFNSFILSAVQILWAGVLLGSLTLIFGQVDSIAGWNEKEVLILAVVGMLFHDIMDLFVTENLEKFSRSIRHGEFDFVLLRPVNPRFMASTRYASFGTVLRLFVLIFILSSLLKGAGVYPGISDWLGFSLLLGAGLIIFYNIFFAVITTNFWLINLFNFNDLFDRVLSSGRYPTDIFKGGLKSFFVYAIPIILIATLPVLALFGKARPEFFWLAGGLVAATS
ncbi:MAG: ABC-2 family transporter protein, partial [bacterium]|nr:ABC-2 family transporter protein [bacterium]